MSNDSSSTSSYITLTDDNFAAEVLQSPQVVLVDFWAAWCGPCRMLNPIVEELAVDFAGTAKVAKLNIDDYGTIATAYNIQAVPTILLFQNGEVVDEIIGVASKRAIAAKLNARLTTPIPSDQAA